LGFVLAALDFWLCKDVERAAAGSTWLQENQRVVPATTRGRLVAGPGAALTDYAWRAVGTLLRDVSFYSNGIGERSVCRTFHRRSA
jgi:hypothetical protein